MGGDYKKLQAQARFAALQAHPPQSWDETAVSDFHEIVSSLEEAYGVDFSRFRVPRERMKQCIINPQRIPRSGQIRRPAPQYSKELYCDDESFVQRQIHGLNSCLQDMDSAPPDQTADQGPRAFTRAETVEQSVGYPESSHDESVRILGAMADSSCWQHLKAYGQGLSEDQQKRIVDAVDKLQEAISAHEKGRAFLSPDGEFNVSKGGGMAESNANRAWRWDDQIRRLKRDILECMEAIVNERAKAFWSLGEVEPFRKQVEADAHDILQRVFACLNTKDLPLLSSTTMKEAIEGIASKWVRKAQLEFPPISPPPPPALTAELNQEQRKAQREQRLTAAKERWRPIAKRDVPFSWIHNAASVDHKDAYDWKNGKLPDISVMAKSIENVLEKPTPPAPPVTE